MAVPSAATHIGKQRTRAVRCYRSTAVLGTLAVAAVLAILMASAIGSVNIPIPREVEILLSRTGLFDIKRTWSDADVAILLELRLPRVLGAFLVGAGLATAGAAMQGLFRNPLVDPYILGSSSGAGLGAVIALALSAQLAFLGFDIVPVFAFAGALGATMLVYALARVGWRTPTTHLLLSGVAVGSVLGSAMSFVMLFTQSVQAQLKSMLVWLLGGLSFSGWTELRVLFPLLIVAIAVTWTLARPLNALALGEASAASLGVPVERTKLLVIACASLLTALSVSVSGLIGFVGLFVPHASRLVVGPGHRLLIPTSALVGGTFLVIIDLIARTVISPNEIPVGLLTALIGGPFFLYLLKRRSRGGRYEL